MTAAQAQSAAIGFGIARWRAWTPGVAEEADWAGWLDGRVSGSADDQPRVDYLPPLLRRRLDRMGRMALHTAWFCAEGLDEFEVVFGSRHGSLGRTADLLADLARGEPLSPSAFSLAVHNSVAGLFSIARGNRCRATAMAAGLDTLGMSLLEGASLVAEGAQHVIVTYAEDRPPPLYESLVAAPQTHPFAISLLLTRQADAPLQCSLAPVAPSAGEPREEPEVALVRFLVEGPQAAVVGVDQPWRLERCAHG
ncbi:MAG TPA: beta-ketoacyl synthase chain length factor [Gammaproteobacteria bacterium]|nr:beta-ketoacyl synthase chain length factor [Gammaproteobacteria bacterium]